MGLIVRSFVEGLGKEPRREKGGENSREGEKGEKKMKGLWEIINIWCGAISESGRLKDRRKEMTNLKRTAGNKKTITPR